MNSGIIDSVLSKRGVVAKLAKLYYYSYCLKRLRLRGGVGGQKGGREAKSAGSVSGCCRGRWEEAWRRGIATSTGLRSNQYWSLIVTRTGHRAK